VKTADDLARLPLIHDESLSARGASPSWGDWFKAAGVDNVDLRRGIRFTSADHALDAAGESAGVLLTHDILAYDGLRTGRLVIPVKFALPAGRAFSLVWPKARKPTAAAENFRRWIKDEAAALDWRGIRTRPVDESPAARRR
jgi:LysR family glycine cleavage system transcriptional activator